MVPIYASTMELLKESFPELITVIHVAPNQHVQDYISGVLHKWPVPARLVAGGSPQAKYDAFSVSPFSLLTMELILEKLLVFCYRTQSKDSHSLLPLPTPTYANLNLNACI